LELITIFVRNNLKENKMALSGTKAQEATLGQYGSIFVNDTDLVTPPSDKIICAITFMADTTVSAMTCENEDENSQIYITTTGTGSHSSGTGDEGTGGEEINAGSGTTIFPKGLTIYGRWTTFQMAAGDADGGVICYLAPKH
tara:strand:- start:142 stop:567 length:426 start_codon:yes stop_codon:yes gene_type:complete